MLYEPLTYKLLGELFLGFALGQALLVAVSIEITAGIGSMYFVYQINLIAFLAKLIFGIHKNQSMLGRNLLATSKELACPVLNDGIVLGRHDALRNNFFTRNIHVVTFVGFRRRRDDGFGETLVLVHALGQLHAAQFATAILIGTPSRAGEDGANDHFHAESLTLHTHGHHRVGGGQFPVGADVVRGV